MDIDEKYKKLEELRKYAELEGTELGEFCAGLCSIARSDAMSDDFELAVNKEIDFQLDNFKTNSKVVETEETFTRTLVDLEWYT